MEAAIHGVLSKLDPYSNYIGPEELAQFRGTVDNQFGGIGIQIPSTTASSRCSARSSARPPIEPGMQAGDRIVEIEGKSTDGIELDDAVRRMKGRRRHQGLDHRRPCRARRSARSSRSPAR